MTKSLFVTAIVVTLGGVLFAADPPPAKEYAKVTFMNPVRVFDAVLIGDYIIEHDTDRMARGEPCTHVYRVDDRTRPVVTFHCRHLSRPLTKRATITLVRTPGLPRGFAMGEFQFENSTDAHGVPVAR